MAKKHYTEDDMDREVTGIDAISPNSDIDAKVMVANSISKTIRSSKFIQVGILAILIALAIAIVQGDITSLFGIQFKE